MKILMRLFRQNNGIYFAELARNQRRSLGARDKAEFLLHKVAFLDFQEEYLSWVYQVRALDTYESAESSFKVLASHLSPDNPLPQISRGLGAPFPGAFGLGSSRTGEGVKSASTKPQEVGGT